MKRNILLLGFVLVILASISLVCFADTTQLILGGGQMGGWWQLFGTAITEVVHQTYPEIIIDYRPGGGLANTINVPKGEIDLGFSKNNVSKAATLGEEPFEEKLPGIKAVLGSVGSKTQIVTPKKTGITSIRQIIDEKKSVRISVGEKASTTELAIRLMLEEYGVTYDDIISWGGTVYFKQFTEANELMTAGRLDVQFNSGACPLSAFIQLATTVDLRMLPIDEKVIEQLSQKYGYAKSYITNEHYDFVTEDTPTFQDLTIIIVREDVPEEIVYKITKAIGDNLDYFYNVQQSLLAMTQETMWQGTGVDLHPGAKRYYKEIGVMD